MRHLVPMILVAGLLAVAGPVFAQEAATPACRVLDAGGRAPTVFAAGDEVIVEGEGFDPGSAVVVTFQQGTRTPVLARPLVDGAGDFVAEGVELPDDATVGPADVRALQGRASASCGITLGTGGGRDLERYYPVGAAAGGLLLVALGLFGWMRMMARRRRTTEEDLAFLDEVDELAADPAAGVEPGDLEHDPMFKLEDEEEADDWGLEPAEEAGPGEEDEEAEGYARAESRAGLEEDPELDGEPGPLREAEAPAEPPVLPDEWAVNYLRPRLRPTRSSSKTVERLRREVQTWKGSSGD